MQGSSLHLYSLTFLIITKLVDFPMLNQIDVAGLSPDWSWHEMWLLWVTHVLLQVSVFLREYCSWSLFT